MLSVNDHLTSPETLDFWNRYFSVYQSVSTEHFCDSIQQEFSALVFKPLLDQLQDD